MIDVEKIQGELGALVGLRQPLDPSLDVLDATSYTSDSGLFIDDVEHFHLSYFFNCVDYKSTDPAVIQQQWDRLKLSAIANVVNSVFTQTCDFRDKKLLFPNGFDRQKPLTLEVGKFYGYEIEIEGKDDLTILLNDVRIEGVNSGKIELELYHSSEVEPLLTKSINLNNDGTIERIPLNWRLSNYRDVHKSYYIIGYRVLADTTFQPFDRVYENSNIMSRISNVDFEAFATAADFSTLSNLDYVTEHNGLNFNVAVYKDYTDLIVTNRHMFAKAVQLQWALAVMLKAVSTTRTNRDQRIAKETLNALLIAIDGVTNENITVKGIRSQLAGELAKLQSEIDKLTTTHFGGKLKSVTYY